MDSMKKCQLLKPALNGALLIKPAKKLLHRALIMQVVSVVD